YIAGICVVYLVQVKPGALAGFGLYRNMLFVAMTMAVLIGFRFSNERFRVTPMDFLVVFLALVVPNLPDFAPKAEHLGMGVGVLLGWIRVSRNSVNNLTFWPIFHLPPQYRENPA